MKYYAVPGYANTSPQVLNEKGEHVATFEELWEAELFVYSINERMSQSNNQYDQLLLNCKAAAEQSK